MTIRARTVFFILLGALIIWFLYLERAILTPFVLAAIFAYVFNPVINFFYHKIRLPRSITIFIIYFLIMAIIVALSIFLSKRIVEESTELNKYVKDLVGTTKNQINTLPDYLRPMANDLLVSVQKSRIFSSSSIFYLFPQAISRIVSLFIFFFSAYYFLKEGNTVLDKFLHLVPRNYKVEVEILLRRMNRVMGGYLRGQLFLVFLVSLTLYIALAILGVKFALIVAIFSGFAEIIPIIGPITAGAVAVLVTFLGGTSNFPMDPVSGALVVIAIYFIVRQLEDYFVIPHVMGKIAGLHPLLILFAVLAGGHLWGVLGLILAVPIAGVVRILFEYFLDKINSASSNQSKSRLSK